MTQQSGWPKIAVVGAGAVGGYFGGLLARAGAPVVMIGRAAFVEAVNKSGLFLDTLQFQESVRVEASTELSAVRGAEIVLFCVKTTDNATTARALASLLTPSALVVSMQNGVDNVEQIRAAAPIEALPAVVYVAASVPEPGRVKHVGRGDLVVGPENEKTKRIAELFSRAQVPCRISENIEGELWTKLIWNCALNAVSALGRAKWAERSMETSPPAPMLGKLSRRRCMKSWRLRGPVEFIRRAWKIPKWRLQGRLRLPRRWRRRFPRRGGAFLDRARHEPREADGD